MSDKHDAQSSNQPIIDVEHKPAVKDAIALNSSGMFEPTTAEQVLRMAHSAIQSKGLPDHIANVHIFVYAWNVLAGMGLKPMAHMAKTWWNSKNNQLGVQVEPFRAAVLQHPEYFGHETWCVDERYRRIDDDNFLDAKPVGAICVVRRKRGNEVFETKARFSLTDAAALGLAGRSNYKTQAGNMLAIRAQGRALKEAFADVIGGVPLQGYDEYDDKESNALSGPSEQRESRSIRGLTEKP